jgi:two-component system, NarL family, sensor histidine kinase UhpB
MAASREEVALEVRSGNSYTALALDAVREAVLIVDARGPRFNIILANAAARRLFRHQRAPLVGASALEFLEFDSRRSFADSIIRLKGGGNRETEPLAWIGPDFSGPLTTEFKVLADPEMDSAVMITLPSTRASQVTEWLKLSMRAAAMYAWRWEREADLFALVLPDDLARHVPSDFRSMQGFFSRVHPGDFDRVSRAVQLAIDEAVEFKEEFRFRMNDDQYRWYASVGRPMLDDNGVVVGLVGATQDVTHRRTSQARVREFGELVRTATANSSDVLLLLDCDLKIRFCNRSIAGLSPQSMTGQLAKRVMNPHDWLMHSQLLQSVVATGVPVSFSHEALGEDGDTHRYESRAIPVYDKGVISGVSVTVTDITERMRLEREILEISTREQERIGQDLHDGLGQELTGVALMLRSLANKIRRDYPNASDDVDDIVVVVNRSIETARSLARGLSPLNSDRGGLVQALRALAARSRELYGLNVRFRSKIWPQLTLDETRSSHLFRIAQEALTNVARHAQATRADVRLLVADNKFTLTIADDGVGLDRSCKSINGMGLKLMAYRAGMIGAKLEISSNEPKGTLVRITGEQPALM